MPNHKRIWRDCPVAGCKNVAEYFRATGTYLCNTHKYFYKQHGFIPDRTSRSPNDIIVCDDYAEIILRDSKNNEVARTKVDLDKIEIAKQYKWYRHSSGYCVHKTKINGVIYLHRLIMEAEKDALIDHINYDKLDNRVANLRFCTYSENAYNRYTREKRPPKSGYRGVSLNEYNKWAAQLVKEGKCYYFGSFVTIEEAIEARRKGEIELFGEFAPISDDP